MGDPKSAVTISDQRHALCLSLYFFLSSLSVYQHLYKVSHSQLTEYLFFSLSHLLLILKEHPNESVSLAAQSKVS